MTGDQLQRFRSYRRPCVAGLTCSSRGLKLTGDRAADRRGAHASDRLAWDPLGDRDHLRCDGGPRRPHRSRDQVVGGLGETARVVHQLAHNGPYRTCLAISGCAFAGALAHVSAGSFVFQNVYGLSTLQFSGAYTVSSVGFIVANQINRRLIERTQPARILAGAQIGTFLTVSAILVTVMTGVATILTLLPLIILFNVWLGFIMANSAALAVISVGRGTGTASALLGATQFGIGALATPLVGLGGDRSATALVTVLPVLGIAGLGLLVIARRNPVFVSGAPDDPVNQAAV